MGGYDKDTKGRKAKSTKIRKEKMPPVGAVFLWSLIQHQTRRKSRHRARKSACHGTR
jgi:hypothetical protein